jgi:hypothetical protein
MNMDALVIEGKRKSDYEIIIAMAKKLGLTVRLANLKSLSPETIKSIKDVENGKVFKTKSHKDLMDQLKK